MLTRVSLMFCLLSAVAVIGCTDSAADDSEAAFVVDGAVSGSAPPDSRIATLWLVTSGADYAFKFGHGTTSGNRFQLTFDSEPPADALSSDGIGLGTLLLVRADVAEDSRLETDAQLDALGIVGMDLDHAVVYRAPDAHPAASWQASFPIGFSCGVCRRTEDGNGHDTLDPTACKATAITVDGALDGACNLD